MYLNGRYILDDYEDTTINLCGNYDIKTVQNDVVNGENYYEYEMIRNLKVEILNSCKVLYQTDNCHIDYLVNVMIQYTFDSDNNLPFDLIHNEFSLGLGQCFFEYQGKLFIVYDRLIFNNPKFCITITKSENYTYPIYDEYDSDDEYDDAIDTLSPEQIVLVAPPDGVHHVHAFQIVDKETGIVEAFAAYT
jgi:hypothetical protein